MILINSYPTDLNAQAGSILNEYWNDRESYPRFWNDLQSTYKCCGLTGIQDWGYFVPTSCYQTQTTWLIWKKTVTCPDFHPNGCYSVILKYLEEMARWFKFFGLIFVSLGGFSIVTMLLITIAYFIFDQQKNSKNSLILNQ